MLAVLTVQAVLAGIPPESALAPTALYLTDTTATLARRIRAGEQWYSPHRSHAYQRLTIAGWSHVRVTGLVAAATAVLIALSLAAFGPLPGRLAADAAAGLVLLAYLRAPRWAARRGRTAAHPLTARPAAPSPHQPARLPAQRRTDDEPDRRAAPGRTR